MVSRYWILRRVMLDFCSRRGRCGGGAIALVKSIRLKMVGIILSSRSFGHPGTCIPYIV